MIFTETKLKGAFILDVKRLEDDRGFFGRSYCKDEFEEHGLNTNIIQGNVSFNKVKGTLRGMHMQAPPYGETKIVRCTRGAIYDVIIDMRPESATFKQWISVELTEDNYRMLYIPEGFAHGFITLEDTTDVAYQITNKHVPIAERGYSYNDPAFGIEWPLEPVVISARDLGHPHLVPEVIG